MKHELTEEEFRTLAKEVLPHLTTVAEIMHEQLGDDWSSSVSIASDGYVSFHPYGKTFDQRWELSKLRDGKPMIHYEYSTPVDISGEE